MLTHVPEEEGLVLTEQPAIGTQLVIDGAPFIVVDRLHEVTDALHYLVAVDATGEMQVIRSAFMSRHKGCWYHRLVSQKELTRIPKG